MLSSLGLVAGNSFIVIVVSLRDHLGVCFADPNMEEDAPLLEDAHKSAYELARDRRVAFVRQSVKPMEQSIRKM